MLTQIVALVAAFAADCANKEFDQCGGSGFNGTTCCQSYDNCTTINAYFSRARPTEIHTLRISCDTGSAHACFH